MSGRKKKQVSDEEIGRLIAEEIAKIRKEEGYDGASIVKSGETFTKEESD